MTLLMIIVNIIYKKSVQKASDQLNANNFLFINCVPLSMKYDHYYEGIFFFEFYNDETSVY